MQFVVICVSSRDFMKFNLDLYNSSSSSINYKLLRKKYIDDIVKDPNKISEFNNISIAECGIWNFLSTVCMNWLNSYYSIPCITNPGMI